MGLLSLLFGSSNNKLQNIKTALNEEALIVDVRSSAEYASGHAKGSINMPLPTLQSGVKKLKNASSLVLCCRSGARAASAQSILSSHGIQSINAGSWQTVEKALKN
jgi:phage shock protein E|tara:strand:+ start:539 stop:856 length:318 start_codon:yes stop_codon:yes gene_type:complete